MKNRLTLILTELKGHSPFTLFGAATGIVCMLIFRNLSHETNRVLFYIFHPAHVLLSAIVTAAIFQLYSKKRSLVLILLIGIVGSIGVSTLSDSVIPYVGELLLGMHVDVHGHGHEHEDEGLAHEAHIGFIEGWYIVFPAAIIGVLIAYFRPKTRFPHAGHVLLSTWASSFHILMAMGGVISAWKLAGSFAFLFLAVLLPCCVSDIVFPLLFVKSPPELCCPHH